MLSIVTIGLISAINQANSEDVLFTANITKRNESIDRYDNV